MKWIGLGLILVGGASIVTALMGLQVAQFDWMRQWGFLPAWVIRIGIFLFGTMIYGFGASSK